MSFQQKLEKGYLSLEKGLVTEASPLAAPEGATSDEVNMTVDITTLRRERRKGLQALNAQRSYSGSIIDCYYWESEDVIVVLGTQEPGEEFQTFDLMFHESDYTFIADYRLNIKVDSAAFPNFSEIRNRLVVTLGANPFIFSRESSGDFSGWYIELYVRDFKLVDDNLQIGERPATLTDEHEYNLYNAGWWKERLVYDGSLTVPEDPVTVYFDEFSEYPSNADIPYLGDISNDFGILTFSAAAMTSVDVGNSEAPRGHYVYNIRAIDRESKLIDKDEDGTESRTLVQMLDDGTNVSGLIGDLIYEEGTPTGTGVDPIVRPEGPPGGGWIEP